MTCLSFLGFLILLFSDSRSDEYEQWCDSTMRFATFKVYFCLVLPYQSTALLDTMEFCFALSIAIFKCIFQKLFF